ncbi:MAG TPA: CHAT domain-containing protein [Candidatus Limnocylindrales bacterium]|nr:CHAT domain-containing protein [Candidatus Limnocylindrales bacterium]
MFESVGQMDAATAMIDLAISELDRNPTQLALAFTDRARVAIRSRDLASAESSLSSARQATTSVRDAILRETLSASIDAAEAVLRIRTRPHEAIATLDHAIAFFSKANLRHLLPDAYLQRARSYRAAGDEKAAIADYDAALHEVDVQRNTISSDDLRLRFLDTATQIIDDSIELHLLNGSVVEALAIADRTRELYESSPASPSSVHEVRLAPGTAVIAYAVLPHAIDIFCVSGGQTTVQKVAIERDGLGERIAQFDDSIRRRAPIDQIQREATSLFKLLVAPMHQQLSGVHEIVIVPDRQLFAVPFAALYDDVRSQYLAEEFTIRFAPSATAVHRETTNDALLPALVVADPATPRWPRLPVSLREGERIAAAYGATMLIGDLATPKRFVEAATGSALIHYAGHADSDAGGSYGALLLAAGDADSGMLAASEIAALHLSKHPLVVLAACGTFRGNSIHVGGMSSLPRAFLLAGARAVAGTLWEVDDDVAASLFLTFHEHLRTGESPARAVRAAQVEMIHASDPRLRHPATWAPIELLSNY